MTQLGHDLLAGLAVAIIAVPLGLAIAISSGAGPEQGLLTVVIGGFLISLLGGSRTQIGGPTAAFIVTVYSVIQAHGYDGLVIATLMAGIILVVAALMRVGTLVRLRARAGHSRLYRRHRRGHRLFPDQGRVRPVGRRGAERCVRQDARALGDARQLYAGGADGGARLAGHHYRHPHVEHAFPRPCRRGHRRRRRGRNLSPAGRHHRLAFRPAELRDRTATPARTQLCQDRRSPALGAGHRLSRRHRIAFVGHGRGQDDRYQPPLQYRDARPGACQSRLGADGRTAGDRRHCPAPPPISAPAAGRRWRASAMPFSSSSF